MRCGVLIIGSLLWDTETEGRSCWRRKRLDVTNKVSVRAPFYYGRKSRNRGNTYTTTFGTFKPPAHGVLVPCTTEIRTIEDILREARALWKAEKPSAQAGSICADWGYVVAMFSARQEVQQLAEKWKAHFPCKTRPDMPVVKPDGTLDIPWPTTADGKPAIFDVILAIATNANDPPPSAHDVADAWADQRGNESYFFNNVLHGIRTRDDGEIWRRLEEKSPRWIEDKAEYQQAIQILRSEAAT